MTAVEDWVTQGNAAVAARIPSRLTSSSLYPSTLRRRHDRLRVVKRLVPSSALACWEVEDKALRPHEDRRVFFARSQSEADAFIAGACGAPPGTHDQAAHAAGVTYVRRVADAVARGLPDTGPMRVREVRAEIAELEQLVDRMADADADVLAQTRIELKFRLAALHARPWL